MNALGAQGAARGLPPPSPRLPFLPPLMESELSQAATDALARSPGFRSNLPPMSSFPEKAPPAR